MNGQTFLVKTPSRKIQQNNSNGHEPVGNGGHKTESDWVLVKTPARSRKILNNNDSNSNNNHESAQNGGVAKSTSLTRVPSQDVDTRGTPYRSRSYSPSKENSSSLKKSPRKSSRNSEVKSRNLKNSVSFEQNHVVARDESPKKVPAVARDESPMKVFVERREVGEKNARKLEHQNSVQNSDKTTVKSKKNNRNDSLINNPDTNPMNPVDKDLNILETIKYYLDSVKQNNYNETREQSLQVGLAAMHLMTFQLGESHRNMNFVYLYLYIEAAVCSR